MKKEELWIDLGYGFLYYNTEAKTLDEAEDNFLSDLEGIGVITDNFGYEAMELREWDNDENYKVIERRR